MGWKTKYFKDAQFMPFFFIRNGSSVSLLSMMLAAAF